MMKTIRLTALLLALIILFCLTACGQTQVSESSEAEQSSESSRSEPSQSSSESSLSVSSESSEPVETNPYSGSNPVFVPPDIEPDSTAAERLLAAEEESDYVVGWLTVPGTVIDYPVAQYTDNDYFLSHDYTGAESSNGSIFVHYHNSIFSSEYLPQNTVIFGHNMWIYTREMFTSLEDFYEMDFAEEHRYLTLTIDGKTTYWLIYAVFDTEVTTGENQFDFYYWNTFGQDENEWQTVQEGIAERTLYNYGIDVEYGDRTIMLSTCSYHYRNWVGLLRDDVRLVIAARLVREGESIYDSPLLTLHEGRREPV